MRLATVVSLLVGAAVLAGRAESQETQVGGAIPGEVTPDDSLWVAHSKGLEAQIRVPVTGLDRAATSLPVIIWFRNPTESPVSLDVIAHAFRLHGELQVLDERGENAVPGECRKKHLMESIVFAPGEVRGFYCDAFAQSCHSLREGGLEPGDHVVVFLGVCRIPVQVR